MGVLDDAIREHLELKRRSGADPSEVERLEQEAFGPISREPLSPPAPAPAADPSAPADAGPTEDELLAEEQPPTSGAPHLGLGLGDPAAPSPYAPPPAEPAPEPEPPAEDLRSAYPPPFPDDAPAAGVPAEDPAAAPHDPGDPPPTQAAADPDRPGLFDDPVRDRPEDTGAVSTSAHDWGEEPWEPPPPARPADQPTQAYSLDDLEAVRREEEEAAAPPPPPDDVVPADPEAHDELEGTPDFLEETPEHDRLWFEQKPPKDFDF